MAALTCPYLPCCFAVLFPGKKGQKRMLMVSIMNNSLNSLKPNMVIDVSSQRRFSTSLTVKHQTLHTSLLVQNFIRYRHSALMLKIQSLGFMGRNNLATNIKGVNPPSSTLNLTGSICQSTPRNSYTNQLYASEPQSDQNTVPDSHIKTKRAPELPLHSKTVRSRQNVLIPTLLFFCRSIT